MSAQPRPTEGDVPISDPRMRQALTDLQARIRERYPSATFQLAAAPDDPAAIHLYATVDLEDTDELLDLVIERLLTLQVEEGLPVHVIPLRTPERRATAWRQVRR